MTLEIKHHTPATGTNAGNGAITKEAWNEALDATMATARILGRVTASSGSVEELTAGQVRTLINVEDGADVTDAANVASAGALMSSANPSLVSLEGLSLVNGDLVYATAADTLARRAIGTTGYVLTVSGGVPAWAANAAIPQVISSASASGSAFTVTSGISGLTRIIAHFVGVSFAGNTALCVQFTSDGGSNWYPSTASSAPLSGTLTAASAYDVTAVIEVSPSGLIGGYIAILGANPASIITAPNAVGSTSSAVAAGNFRLSSALNGVRFVPSTATTFDAGTITVTGS